MSIKVVHMTTTTTTTTTTIELEFELSGVRGWATWGNDIFGLANRFFWQNVH
jgi:hypothetical protein